VHPDQLYLDRTSGAKSSRPAWDVLCKALRAGDVLVATRLDRVGRSTTHLVTLLDQLAGRGVAFRFLEQGIDTSTAVGRMFFQILGAIAEFQRDLIIANTREGLTAARARGRKGGRKPKLTAPQVQLAQQLYDAGEKLSPRSPRSSPCPAPPSTATSTTDPPALDHEPANPRPPSPHRPRPQTPPDHQPPSFARSPLGSHRQTSCHPNRNARCVTGWSASAKQCAPPAAQPAETNQSMPRPGGSNAKPALLAEREVYLVVLKQGIDTTTPAGRFCSTSSGRWTRCWPT
jgi:DNA invertase Pin-like site-specific DNA recombinase